MGRKTAKRKKKDCEFTIMPPRKAAMTTKRIYNLQSKQLVKLFSRIFRSNQQDMLIDLEQGKRYGGSFERITN